MRHAGLWVGALLGLATGHQQRRQRGQRVQNARPAQMLIAIEPVLRHPAGSHAQRDQQPNALAHPAVLDELCEQAVGGRAWETRASRELGEGEPIAGVELVRDKTTREAYPYGLQVGAKVCAQARRYGVIIRPLADTVVIIPPLCISPANLEHLVNTVVRCIEEVMPDIHSGTSDGLE